MQIKNARIETYVPSPNHGRMKEAPSLLVIHYTAGWSLANAVRTLTDPEHRASAHLVIGRDGDWVQLVEFGCVAWHAGTSEWNGRDRVNDFSIGIELVNLGRVAKAPTYNGRYHVGKHLVPASELVAREDGVWHRYTTAQLEVLVQLSRLILREYPSITAIVGHSDVSPGRKIDPGPAFPMEWFQKEVMECR